MSLHLSKNIAASVLQVLIGALLLFVLYRYVNQTLGVDRLGIWSVVLAAASASRLADLGLSASVTRFVARDLADHAPDRAARVIDTTAIALMILAGILIPLLYLPLRALLPRVFESEYLLEAKEILPIALVSLWLSLVSSVYQGGLDGCRRMDLRATVIVTGQVAILLLALLLIPEFGLRGLAWAQVGQGTLLLVLGRALLRSQIGEMDFLRHRCRAESLKEIWRYSANIQLANIFIVLLDPVTKALMGAFGGPVAAGLYEMASQVVVRLRALIIAANQAIVPYVAAIGRQSDEKVVDLYRGNMRFLIFATLPAFSLLISLGWFISALLLGESDPDFIGLMSVAAGGAVINIFSAPAYFINMGRGNIGWNTGSHVVMGVLNVVLGLLLGVAYGSYGVAAASALALVAGSWFLIAAFQRSLGISTLTAEVRCHWRLILASIAVAAAGIALPATLDAESPWPTLCRIVAPMVVLAVAAWFDPLRNEMVNQLVPRWRRS